METDPKEQTENLDKSTKEQKEIVWLPVDEVGLAPFIYIGDGIYVPLNEQQN